MTSSELFCPTCRKPVSGRSPPFPFCSERCQLVDLGRWLTDGYRISRPVSPSAVGDPLAAGEAEEDISSEESHDD